MAFALLNIFLTFSIFNVIKAELSCVSGDICLPENYSRLDPPYTDKVIDVRVDLGTVEQYSSTRLEYNLDNFWCMRSGKFDALKS